MKVRLLFLLTLILSATLPSMAQESFTAVNSDGVTIGYRTNGDDMTVSLVYIPDGDVYSTISIPDVVTYQEIEYKVTTIGWNAFSNCTSLTSVTIPESVNEIEETAFEGSGIYNDESMWDNGVLYISNWLIRVKESFSGKYEIKSGTRGIAAGAFSSCSDLTSVTVPSSVTQLADRTFCNCFSLTSIELPETLISIGYSTFEGCRSLNSINIPESVIEIGTEAFYESGIYNDESNWEKGVLYISNWLIKADESVSGEYTIKSGTNGIAAYAFSENGGPTSINIPDTVKFIGEYSFNYCYRLKDVSFPNSVISIGKSAFSECVSLASVTISDSVTSIGEFAFKGCSSLKTFNGKYASDDNRCLIIDGVLNAFAPSGLTSYNIPATVTEIGIGAFEDCLDLSTINIPNSVKTIQYCAFYGCKALTSIEIPNSVTCIGVAAFAESALTSLNIPNSVNSIKERAFSYCHALTSVILPNSLKTIPREIFSFCSSLTSVEIPNSVLSINQAAFISCNALTSVKLPGSLTYIGPGAFSYSGLTSVEIPNSVIYIDSDAFSNTPLERLVIGNSVEMIGWECFNIESESLKEVYVLALTPPEANWEPFNNNTYEEATLYVPAGKKEEYAAAEGWKNFNNIVESDFAGISSAWADGAVVGDVYDMQGVCVKRAAAAEELNVLPAGIYLYRGKKVIVK